MELNFKDWIKNKNYFNCENDEKFYFDRLPENISINEIINMFENVAILELIDCHLGPDPFYNVYFNKKIDIESIENDICNDFNICENINSFERNIKISETNQRTFRILNELRKNGAQFFIILINGER